MTHQARLREAARSIRRVATFTRTLEGPEAYAERLRLAEAQEAGAAALEREAQQAETVTRLREALRGLVAEYCAATESNWDGVCQPAALAEARAALSPAGKE